MIVTCPCPNSKQFEVDDSLIPKKGRLVQCGICGQKWQVKIEENFTEINQNFTKFSTETNYDNDTNLEINENYIKTHDDKIVTTKQSNLVNDKKIVNPLNYLKVLIIIVINLIALIIILDTFKSPLKVVFPQIENMLQNLYETLKDIFLFFKDLID
tara:strand:+ start:15 stop:482 length:468 start_codon:yes stop_codon:yes gene_type:complete